MTIKQENIVCKGNSAVLRRLNYIIDCCNDEVDCDRNELERVFTADCLPHLFLRQPARVHVGEEQQQQQKQDEEEDYESSKQQSLDTDSPLLCLCYRLGGLLVQRCPDAPSARLLIQALMQSLGIAVVDNGDGIDGLPFDRACRLLATILSHSVPLSLIKVADKIVSNLLYRWQNDSSSRPSISKYALPAVLNCLKSVNDNNDIVDGDNYSYGDRLIGLALQTGWPYLRNERLRPTDAVDSMHLLVSCFNYLPIHRWLDGSAGDSASGDKKIELIEFLQLALVNSQPEQHIFIQKSSLFMLKRIIDQSPLMAYQLATAVEEDTASLNTEIPIISQLFWNEWMFLVETIRERSMHLLESLQGKLVDFIRISVHFHPSWRRLLFELGCGGAASSIYSNHSGSSSSSSGSSSSSSGSSNVVSATATTTNINHSSNGYCPVATIRWFAHSVLLDPQSVGERELEILCSDPPLIYSTIVPIILGRPTLFYTDRLVSSARSEFGEQLAGFIRHCCLHLMRSHEGSVDRMIGEFAHTCLTRITFAPCTIYIMVGISEFLRDLKRRTPDYTCVLSAATVKRLIEVSHLKPNFWSRDLRLVYLRVILQVLADGCGVDIDVPCEIHETSLPLLLLEYLMEISDTIFQLLIRYGWQPEWEMINRWAPLLLSDSTLAFFKNQIQSLLAMPSAVDSPIALKSFQLLAKQLVISFILSTAVDSSAPRTELVAEKLCGSGSTIRYLDEIWSTLTRRPYMPDHVKWNSSIFFSELVIAMTAVDQSSVLESVAASGLSNYLRLKSIILHRIPPIIDFFEDRLIQQTIDGNTLEEEDCVNLLSGRLDAIRLYLNNAGGSHALFLARCLEPCRVNAICSQLTYATAGANQSLLAILYRFHALRFFACQPDDAVEQWLRLRESLLIAMTNRHQPISPACTREVWQAMWKSLRSILTARHSNSNDDESVLSSSSLYNHLFELLVESIDTTDDYSMALLFECFHLLISTSASHGIPRESASNFIRAARRSLEGSEANMREIKAFLPWLIRSVCHPFILLLSPLNGGCSDVDALGSDLVNLLQSLVDYGRRWRTGSNRLLVSLLFADFLEWPAALMLDRYFELLFYLIISSPGASASDLQLEIAVANRFRPSSSMDFADDDYYKHGEYDKHGESEDDYFNRQSFVLNESLPRIQVCAQLARLDPLNQSHCILGARLYRRLIAAFSKTLSSVPYANSEQGLVKFRCWQTILILTDLLGGGHTENGMMDARDVVEEMIEMLRVEQLLEIRHFIEQSIVRMLIKWPHLASTIIWQQRLAAEWNFKPGFYNSILLIAKLVGPHLDDTELQLEWFRYLFTCVPALCAHNHNLVRLHAIWTLWSAYNYCMESRDQLIRDLLQQNIAIRQLVDFIRLNKEWVKFRRKCEASVLMAHFDARSDFSIDWIFRQLPAIGAYAETESIPAETFLRAVGDRSGWRIPLWGRGNGVPFHVEAVAAVQETNEDEKINNDFKSLLSLHNDCHQRKIIPWQQMLFDSDFDFANRNLPGGRQRNSNQAAVHDLILVSSLILKPTNLGALCRSGEVFNIRSLVVANGRIVEDPLFVTLAVSSEKWLPIEEVRKPNLLKYLTDRKADGYSLIGLEQTTNSQNLHGFRYPKKSLILLGNERYGIPAEFLQIMDVCVEIPQYGNTRSMNVHVSASLCLYEYAKQWGTGGGGGACQ